MSQEQPPGKAKSQAPRSPKPKISQRRAALQKAVQALQQAWKQTQPILRTQSIKLLQGTIQVLKGVLAKLETPTPTATQPAPSSVTAGEITQSDSPQPPEAAKPATPLGKPSESGVPASWTKRLGAWWNSVLGLIRSRLPESLNQKLSDRVLTGVLTGTFLLLLGTSAILLDKSSQVGDVPASQPVPPPPLRAPPELSASQPESVEAAPQEPVVFPPPVPELTPEQKLLANIQQQVSELSNQYVEGLLQSIQADFPGHHLTLKLTNSWYNLTPAQQDTLMDEALHQAQELDFGKLEVMDFKGTLLARSPVVGPNMVVIQRQLPASVAASSAS